MVFLCYVLVTITGVPSVQEYKLLRGTKTGKTTYNFQIDAKVKGYRGDYSNVEVEDNECFNIKDL